MPPPSLFTRPARGANQPISAALASQLVKNEQQLRAAIARIAASGGGGFQSPMFGAEIVIAAPIALAAAVEIPAACTGLTIRGAGKAAFTSDGTFDAVFIVRASAVTLREMSVPNALAAFRRAFAIVQAGDTVSDVIIEEIVTIGGLGVEVDGVASQWSIERCKFPGNPANGVGVVSGNFQNCSISGNAFSGNAADSGVVVGVNGDHNAIVGNLLGGMKITTTGSNGHNAVVANVASNPITHATDQVGLNT